MQLPASLWRLAGVDLMDSAVEHSFPHLWLISLASPARLCVSRGMPSEPCSPCLGLVSTCFPTRKTSTSSQAREAAERYAWLGEKATPRTIQSYTTACFSMVEGWTIWRALPTRLGILVSGSTSRDACVPVVILTIPGVCELALLRGRLETPRVNKLLPNEPDGQHLENVDGTCFHRVSPPDGEVRTPYCPSGSGMREGNITGCGHRSWQLHRSWTVSTSIQNVPLHCKYLNFDALTASLRNMLLSRVP
jgi:hypothetical protein